MATEDCEIVLDAEIQSLLPPPDPEERQQLEANLEKDGCLDPLKVWAGHQILIDGHNRLEICRRLNIPYSVVEVELPDRAAVVAWVVAHQLGRRNLNNFQRAELALILKPQISAEAAQRQRSGKPISAANPSKTDAPDLALNLAQGARAPDARAQVAAIAKVSSGTVAKVEAIKTASPALAEMARKGEVSVQAAAKVAQLLKPEMEQAISAGAVGVQAAARAADEKGGPPATTDANKQPIEHEHVAKAFAVVPEFRSLMSRIASLKGDFEQVATGPAGWYAANSLKQFRADVENLHRCVRECTPHAICPSCGGEKCERCRQQGWVPKERFQLIQRQM